MFPPYRWPLVFLRRSARQRIPANFLLMHAMVPMWQGVIAVSAVAAGAGTSGFVGDGEHASRNLDDLLGDLGSDDEARVVVTTRDQVATSASMPSDVHVDGAGVPKFLEFLPALSSSSSASALDNSYVAVRSSRPLRSACG